MPRVSVRKALRAPGSTVRFMGYIRWGNGSARKGEGIVWPQRLWPPELGRSSGGGQGPAAEGCSERLVGAQGWVVERVRGDGLELMVELGCGLGRALLQASIAEQLAELRWAQRGTSCPQSCPVGDREGGVGISHSVCLGFAYIFLVGCRVQPGPSGGGPPHSAPPLGPSALWDLGSVAPSSADAAFMPLTPSSSK